VTAADGSEIPGSTGTDWWASRGRLRPATEYQVRALVRPKGGRSQTRTWKFSTAIPAAGLGAKVIPGDDEVVGVGMPITLKFNQPVVNKAAVEQRLEVRTSVPVKGSWRWFGDKEVHWRPLQYWPANIEVWMNADLVGVDAGNGVFGDVNRTVHFKIGDAHVSTADTATHTMTVTDNGQVVRTMPISAGRDKYPTMSGTHIVIGKAPTVVMDSRTNGIPLDSPDGYLETVLWDTQISSTGEYVHAAPWSVGSQGRANVSHGCINVATDQAQWFFEFSQKGDIVQVNGTSRGPNEDIAVKDWKIPAAQWAAGSALALPGYTPPRPRLG
jgi:lipoprotein-anchoring transpeptidase ErfK/SrfK